METENRLRINKNNKETKNDQKQSPPPTPKNNEIKKGKIQEKNQKVMIIEKWLGNRETPVTCA